MTAPTRTRPHTHPDTPTISAAYRDEQIWLHAEPRGYGGRGSKWAEVVAWLRTLYGARTVLDYGCGQGSLAAAVIEHGPRAVQQIGRAHV